MRGTAHMDPSFASQSHRSDVNLTPHARRMYVYSTPAPVLGHSDGPERYCQDSSLLREQVS